MGLVISIVKSFHPSNYTKFDDYYANGIYGLFRAIRYYNPKRAKFSTLAWYCIRHEIIKYIKLTNKYNKLNKLSLHSVEYTTPENLWEYVPATLTKKEKMVLELKLANYNFTEIGKKLGNYTQGWASKLYASAIKKIKKANS